MIIIIIILTVHYDDVEKARLGYGKQEFIQAT